MTYTYAILEISKAAYDEIKQRLTEASYEHTFDRDVIDMHGIALRAIAQESTHMDGTISRILRDKGFGFIRLQTGGEFFFHRSDVAAHVDFDSLDNGDRVSFDAVTPQPSKGPRATRIELA